MLTCLCPNYLFNSQKVKVSLQVILTNSNVWCRFCYKFENTKFEDTSVTMTKCQCAQNIVTFPLFFYLH